MSEISMNTRPPFISFLYLLMLIFAGALVFSLFGVLIAGLFYGFGSVAPGFLKTIQVISSIGTFLIPAWIFVRSENKPALQFFKLNTPFYPILALLTITLMFGSASILEWTIRLNQKMHLPAFLQALESWMKAQESQLAELTQKLLLMHSPADLIINLLIIALLPALCEELIFRGCFQKVFTRWTKNNHWGIWITAIVFSAIHLQFFGFLPRMLLGALFGYLLVWGNSLWFPILGHFINNATAVIAVYIAQKQGKPIESLEQIKPENTSVYLLSLFFTLAVLWLFYQYAHQKQTVKTDVHNA